MAPVEPWNSASPKVKNATVGGDHVVALPGGRGDGVEHGAVEGCGAHVPEGRCVTEGDRPGPVVNTQ